MDFPRRHRFALRLISGVIATAFLVQDLAWAAPAMGLVSGGGAMPEIGFQVPASAGVMDDFYKAPAAAGRTAPDKLIVLVQDAHTNASAQFNAARVLDEVLAREGVKLVFTEADHGNVSLGYLRKYFSPETLRSVSENFVRKGALKGTELLSAASEHDFTLWGVESPVLYDESLRAYAEVTGGRDRALAYADQLKRSLRALQKEVFNADLAHLDARRALRNEGTLSLADYADLLWKKAGQLGIYREPYRGLTALSRVSRLEKKIDFKRAAKEADEALRTLDASAKDRLNAAAGHASEASAVKRGENASAGYYAALEEELRKTLPVWDLLRKYPSLGGYFGYLTHARRFEAIRAVEELDLLEAEVFARLARTPEEKHLLEFSRNAEDLEAALRLELSPERFERFEQRQSRFDVRMIGGYVNYRILQDAKNHDRAVFLNDAYEKTLAEAVRFYRLAAKRDRIFVDRMVRAMDENGQVRAALFAGGFHAPGIKHLLRARGISFVSVLPQVTHETDHARYEKILLSQSVHGRKSRLAAARKEIRTARAPRAGYAAQPKGVIDGARLAFFEALSRSSDRTAPSAASLLEEGRAQSGLLAIPAASAARMAHEASTRSAQEVWGDASVFVSEFLSRAYFGYAIDEPGRYSVHPGNHYVVSTRETTTEPFSDISLNTGGNWIQIFLFPKRSRDENGANGAAWDWRIGANDLAFLQSLSGIKLRLKTRSGKIVDSDPAEVVIQERDERVGGRHLSTNRAGAEVRIGGMQSLMDALVSDTGDKAEVKKFELSFVPHAAASAARMAGGLADGYRMGDGQPNERQAAILATSVRKYVEDGMAEGRIRRTEFHLLRLADALEGRGIFTIGDLGASAGLEELFQDQAASGSKPITQNMAFDLMRHLFQDGILWGRLDENDLRLLIIDHGQTLNMSAEVFFRDLKDPEPAAGAQESRLAMRVQRAVQSWSEKRTRDGQGAAVADLLSLSPLALLRERNLGLASLAHAMAYANRGLERARVPVRWGRGLSFFEPESQGARLAAVDVVKFAAGDTSWHDPAKRIVLVVEDDTLLKSLYGQKGYLAGALEKALNASGLEGQFEFVLVDNLADAKAVAGIRDAQGRTALAAVLTDKDYPETPARPGEGVFVTQGAGLQLIDHLAASLETAGVRGLIVSALASDIEAGVLRPEFQPLVKGSAGTELASLAASLAAAFAPVSAARMSERAMPVRKIAEVSPKGVQTTAAEADRIEPVDSPFLTAMIEDARANVLEPLRGGPAERSNPVRDILTSVDALAAQGKTPRLRHTGDLNTLADVRGDDIWLDTGFEALAAEMGVTLQGGSLSAADDSAESRRRLDAFRMLAAMSYLHAVQVWTGEDPNRAMLQILEFIAPYSREVRAALIDALRRSTAFDGSNLFAFYLEMSLDEELPFRLVSLDRVRGLKDVDLSRPAADPATAALQQQKRDLLLRWRMHWTQWLAARGRIDEPFNVEPVRDAIRTAKTTTELRARLQEALKASYDRKTDILNIRKLWREAREKKQSIWSVLFTRAFSLSALSIATAKHVRITSSLRQAVRGVRELIAGVGRLSAAAEALRGFNDKFADRVRLSAVQVRSGISQLEILAGETGRKVPGMLFAGAVDDLEKSFNQDFRQKTAQALNLLTSQNSRYRDTVLAERRESAAQMLFDRITGETAADGRRAELLAIFQKLTADGYAAGSADAVTARKVQAVRLLLGDMNLTSSTIAEGLDDAVSPTERKVEEARAALAALEQDFQKAIARLRVQADAAADKDAGFVFLHRRISKDIGAYDYAMMMYAIDPFTRDWTGAENETLGLMMGEGAANTYISPDDTVLEMAENVQVSLPLFIHNEHIDYQLLENTLRNWSEPLYRNIKRAKSSEYVAIAREIVARQFASAEERAQLARLDSRPEDREEAVRQLVKAHVEWTDAVAATAAAVERLAQADDTILTMARLHQERQADGVSQEPFELLREVALERMNAPVTEADAETAASEAYRTYQAEASERRELLRNIFIGTTQSLGMTQHLLGYWIMEGLFISKVKDDHGLHGEVRAKKAEYRATLAAAGEIAARELDLTARIELGVSAGAKREQVVYGLTTGDYQSMLGRPASVIHFLARRWMMSPVEGHENRIEAHLAAHASDAGFNAQAETALLANWPGRDLEELLGSADRRQELANLKRSLAVQALMKEAAADIDTLPVLSGEGVPASVADYAAAHTDELSEAALSDFASATGMTRADAAAQYGKDADVTATIDRMTRSLARERVAELAAKQDGLLAEGGSFNEFIERYFYSLTQIQDTTAAKEVIGLHDLSRLAADPRYALTYDGPFKAFNLVYLPSRIDFGADTEIGSIQEWPQWVGATDRISHDAALQVVGLFNKRPAVMTTSRGAEVAKPNENTGLLAEAMTWTIAGLAYNAAGWGDSQMLAHQSNLRTEPSPRVNAKPTSDFIAGFCLPKDWEWIRFVNRLQTEEALLFWGVLNQASRDRLTSAARAIHQKLEAARATGDFDTFMRVLREEQEKFYADPEVKRHFAQIDGAFVPKMDMVTEALSEFGQTFDDQQHLAKLRTLSAWMGDLVIAQLEKANRTLPHIKTFLMHRAWELARRRNPLVALWSEMKVVRGSEYKADRFSGAVRDPRNAPGPAILEVFARTRGYAFKMFTDEERTYAESIVWGRRPKTAAALIELLRTDDPNVMESVERTMKAIGLADPNTSIDDLMTALARVPHGDDWTPSFLQRIEKHLIARSLSLVPLDVRARIETLLADPASEFTSVDDFLNALGAEDAALAAEVGYQWYGIEPPAEFRLVTTTGQTAKDILTYHVDASLDETADEVQALLNGAGMDEKAIEAHLLSYGTNLREWRKAGRGLSKLDDAAFETLRREIGGRILVLGVKVIGLYGGYDLAAQRADILDAGLPAPELIALLEEPAYLRDLMKRENPNSALAIVDGAGQARPRSMTPEMVRMWLASDPNAVYVAMGVGEDTVEEWREQMNNARSRAVKLYDYMAQGDYEGAHAFYLTQVRPEAAKRSAAYRQEEETNKGSYGMWTERDGVLVQLNAAVHQTRLEDLDFASWLAAGGMYALNGLSAGTIADRRQNFAEAQDGYRRWLASHEDLAAQDKAEPLSAAERAAAQAEAVRIEKLLIKPSRSIHEGDFATSQGDTGSLKSAGDKAKTPEEIKKEAALEKARGAGRDQRKSGYDKTAQAAKGMPVEAAYDAAMTALGAPDAALGVSETAFGQFMAYAQAAAAGMVRQILPAGDPRRADFEKKVAKLFGGTEVTHKNWQALAGSYTDKGVIGQLAESVAGDDLEARKAVLRQLAKIAELTYIALVLEKTRAYSELGQESISQDQLWKDIAGLGAEIFYDHVFNYPPIFGQTMRGVGFTDYDEIRGPILKDGVPQEGQPFTQEEILGLGTERYDWIYGFIRNLIVTKTADFSSMSEAERNDHLGLVSVTPTASGVEARVEHRAVAVGGYAPNEDIWLNQVNWREVAFYKSEGRPVPVRLHVGASVLKAGERSNIMYVAPPSRQHMTAGVEEGPTLQKEGFPVNVMIGRSLRKIENYSGSGHTAYAAEGAYMFLSREDFIAAYVQMHGEAALTQAETIADEQLKGNPKGVFVAVSFTEEDPMIVDAPIPYHGLSPFVRREFEKLGYPHNVNGSSSAYTFMYDKAEYHLAYDPESGELRVMMPGEVQWYQAWTQALNDSGVGRETILDLILNGWNEKFESALGGLGDQGGALSGIRNWQGLAPFFAERPATNLFIAKAGTQSGGRQTDVFRMEPGAKEAERAAELRRAAEFLYDQSTTDNFVVQQYIHTHPAMMLTPQALEHVRDRVVGEKKFQVVLNEKPTTFLTIFGRIMVSYTPQHAEAMARQQTGGEAPDYTLFHQLFGISVDKVGNVGRGGIILEMLPEYLLAGIREKVYERMGTHARESARSMEAYLQSDAFRTKYREMYGEEPSETTLAEMRYSMMSYVMYDILVSPLFKRVDEQGRLTGEVLRNEDAQLVDFELVRNDKGEVVRTRLFMRDPAGNIFEAAPFDVDIVKIEDNAGTGLKHPFKAAEKKRALAEAKAQDRTADITEWGAQLRVMLASFAAAGAFDAKARYGKVVAWGAEQHAKMKQLAKPRGFSEVESRILTSKDRAESMRLALVTAAAASGQRVSGPDAQTDPVAVSVFMKKLGIQLAMVQKWYEQKADFEFAYGERPGVLADEIFQSLYHQPEIWDWMIASGRFTEDRASLSRMLSDPAFVYRIAELAAEEILVPTVAPEVAVAAEPQPAAEALRGTAVSAVVFETPVGALAEIARLMGVHGPAVPGADPVIGVRADWLDAEGRATRALLWDAEAGVLREHTFTEPVRFTSAFVRNISGSGEQERYRRLARRLQAAEVVLVNPPASSAKADSKIAAYHAMRENGVETPETLFLPSGVSASEAVKQVRRVFAGMSAQGGPVQLVVQPNNGTEGQGVAAFAEDPGQLNSSSPMIQHLVALAASGQPVIVRPLTGNTYHTQDGQTGRVVYRATVARTADGGYRVAGVFGTVSADESVVSTARGAGGRIVTLSEGLIGDSVHVGADGEMVEPGSWTWDQDGFESTARNAAAAVNQGLGTLDQSDLLGIDLVLTVDPQTGAQTWSVLDINPRPAGLAFAQDWEGRGISASVYQPSVTAKQKLSDDYAEAMRQARTRTSSVPALQASIASAWSFLNERRAELSAEMTSALNAEITSAEDRLERRLRIEGRLMDHSGRFTGTNRAEANAQVPGLSRAVPPQDAVRLNDTELSELWDRIDAAQARAGVYGRGLEIAVPLRALPMGGIQDAGPYINAMTLRGPHLLEQAPSIITAQSSNMVRLSIAVARDAAGNVLKDQIRYSNKTWGYTFDQKVPAELTKEGWTPAGQRDAVAYILGIFGLRGIEVSVEVDHPAMLVGGGFESSNAYDLDVAIAAQVLTIATGRMVTAEQVFAMLRFMAPNIFGDRTGMQGALAAYQEAPFTRHYFLGARRDVDGEPINPHAVFSETVAGEAAMEWLSARTVGVMPGIKILDGERSEPRLDMYTGRMMFDLVQVIADDASVAQARRMIELITVFHDALANQDLALLISATREYRDIRYGFQKRWFELYREGGEAFASKVRHYYAGEGEWAVIDRIAAEKAANPDLYTGGHAHLIELEKKHSVAVAPLGKGGVGANWILHGEPADIRAFLAEAGLDHEITDTEALEVLQSKDGQERSLKGWVPIYLDHTGIRIAPELHELAPGLSTDVPTATYDQAGFQFDSEFGRESVRRQADRVQWGDETLRRVEENVVAQFTAAPEDRSIQFLQGGIQAVTVDTVRGQSALYVDLGGSTIHMGIVEVDEATGEIRKTAFEDLLLTDEDKRSGVRVFQLIADKIKAELEARGLSGRADLAAGFTFSFPHDKGVILPGANGVKGFNFDDLASATGVPAGEGEEQEPVLKYPNVLDLLNSAMNERGLGIRFNAVANDTEAALIQGMLMDPKVAASIIGGTGFNIAAVLKTLITNLEAGGYRVQDVEGVDLTGVDRFFMKRGAEELIAGGFLGPLLRLMVLEQAESGGLMGRLLQKDPGLARRLTSALSQKKMIVDGREEDVIRTADIAKLAEAPSEEAALRILGGIFDRLVPGVSASLDREQDLLPTLRLATAVLDRSADLVAAMTAGILKAAEAPKDARVAVDGAMWSNSAYFNRVNTTLGKLLGRPGAAVLLRVQDASGVGAALTALVQRAQAAEEALKKQQFYRGSELTGIDTPAGRLKPFVFEGRLNFYRTQKGAPDAFVGSIDLADRDAEIFGIRQIEYDASTDTVAVLMQGQGPVYNAALGSPASTLEVRTLDLSSGRTARLPGTYFAPVKKDVAEDKKAGTTRTSFGETVPRISLTNGRLAAFLSASADENRLALWPVSAEGIAATPEREERVPTLTTPSRTEGSKIKDLLDAFVSSPSGARLVDAEGAEADRTPADEYYARILSRAKPYMIDLEYGDLQEEVRQGAVGLNFLTGLMSYLNPAAASKAHQDDPALAELITEINTRLEVLKDASVTATLDLKRFEPQLAAIARARGVSSTGELMPIADGQNVLGTVRLVSNGSEVRYLLSANPTEGWVVIRPADAQVSAPDVSEALDAAVSVDQMLELEASVMTLIAERARLWSGKLKPVNFEIDATRMLSFIPDADTRQRAARQLEKIALGAISRFGWGSVQFIGAEDLSAYGLKSQPAIPAAQARTIRLQDPRVPVAGDLDGKSVMPYQVEEGQIIPVLTTLLTSYLVANLRDLGTDAGSEDLRAEAEPLIRKLALMDPTASIIGSDWALFDRFDPSAQDRYRTLSVKGRTLRGYLNLLIYLQQAARLAVSTSA
jgi:hexokinase